ncbi:ergothioneine biosynthesis protein EgtB [Pedobacter alpinus]|uniref:Ergothioneine biosynthesis protein EgtB n=1 Tax=Pedobacter alpinus TaxID=1590643 RepID=A0ABW5TSU8_9SPHI
MNLLEKYLTTRKLTENICQPLQTEDYVVQPIEDVSPPKWHLGHTTWFFETFILQANFNLYKDFDPNYNYVFNSYYETVGARVIRTDRGNLSRPTVMDVYKYRAYVDEAMVKFLACEPSEEVSNLLQLGINHEQQHQELLWYDIKYILGHNPLFPAYADENIESELKINVLNNEFSCIKAGVYEIGYNGDDFCFDNELGRHKVYINDFEISNSLVTNKDYLTFIEANGYQNFKYWHAEAWDWVNKQQIKAPLYWHLENGEWFRYGLSGLKPINLDEPVCHLSFYEAAAFASFMGMRLPTEFEWEVAASNFEWGKLWEWTESAYLPYPGFEKAPGAIGEYNGKFMVNQKVLRGASLATSPAHGRPTYRNFFHPHLRWMYSGLRLVK